MKDAKWRTSPIHGILVVDKPFGLTSHDMVDFVRRRFSIPRVGHAGTLDPMATGVLVLLLGRMTRLQSHFISEDKEYDATFRLGARTDSGDAMGKIIDERPWQSVTREQVEGIFRSFMGLGEQVPPMVSALKHKGQRLYVLARQGKEVPRAARSITIHRLDLTSFEPPLVGFHLISSKGTYVRTLCDDIGIKLGCGAHLSRLVRLRSGHFRLAQAVTRDQLMGMDLAQLRSVLVPIPAERVPVVVRL